jgi:dTDP-4-dehydrorhamnose 3,5-epimerase
MHDDPALGLTWPLPVTEISEKDGGWPLLEDVEDELRHRMSLTPVPEQEAAR